MSPRHGRISRKSSEKGELKVESFSDTDGIERNSSCIIIFWGKKHFLEKISAGQSTHSEKDIMVRNRAKNFFLPISKKSDQTEIMFFVIRTRQNVQLLHFDGQMVFIWSGRYSLSLGEANSFVIRVART